MTDAALVELLTWAAPRLRLRLTGVLHFRRTVKKRLVRRIAELGVGDADYRRRLEADASEWAHLEAMCRIPISRLYRDHQVFDLIGGELLPERARAAEREGRHAVRVWSAGCASGEEPTTVAMIWHVDVAPAHPGITLELIATDVDRGMIARAQQGSYGRGSVRELPARLAEVALQSDGSGFRVGDAFREGVTFRCEDIRRSMPGGQFDVVMCRNMLLTYVSEELHAGLIEEMAGHLLPNGVLVIGSREALPREATSLEADPRAPGVYRRR